MTAAAAYREAAHESEMVSDFPHTPLTEESIRTFVNGQKWYLPINFGNDIVARPFNWPHAPLDTPQLGIGRFNFILQRNLPDLTGKRVLDLGCNAGLISLHMSRLGAREVVAVDSKTTWQNWLNQAKFVKQVFELRSNARYNLRFIDADMRSIPSLNLGSFDLVTALCCIYYLSDDDIRALVRFLSSVTEMLVLQGNTIRNDHRAHPETKRRARSAYLIEVLRTNGFPYVTVDAPLFYGRPVIVGRRTAVKPRRSRIASIVKWAAAKISYIPLRVEARFSNTE